MAVVRLPDAPKVSPAVNPETWMQWAETLIQVANDALSTLNGSSLPQGQAHDLPIVSLNQIKTATRNTKPRGHFLVVNPSSGNQRPAFIGTDGVPRYYDGSIVT
jgi:hypothetical protein